MRRTTLFTLVALAAACGSKPAPPPPPAVVAPTPTPIPPPPSVASVTLGNSLGVDKSVTPAETFAVKDTIYASIATTGSGHVKLRALWSYVKGGKTAKVNDKTMEFDSTGPATNEFHVENPKGWPKGEYKVDIFLGDSETPAITKTFKVQ